eukprot:3535643-Amphidinium_carterae.1
MPPRSALLGAYTTRGAGVSEWTKKQLELLELVHKCAKLRRGCRSRDEYLSVMVNQHVAQDDYVLHRDKNNLPGSLNWVRASICEQDGSATKGGRIWVADYAGPSPVPTGVRIPEGYSGPRKGRFLNPMEGWIAFDQSQYHCVEPLKGKGYRSSVVLFTPSGLSRLSCADWNELEGLAFPCEEMLNRVGHSKTRDIPRSRRKRLKQNAHILITCLFHDVMTAVCDETHDTFPVRELVSTGENRFAPYPPLRTSSQFARQRASMDSTEMVPLRAGTEAASSWDVAPRTPEDMEVYEEWEPRDEWEEAPRTPDAEEDQEHVTDVQAPTPKRRRFSIPPRMREIPAPHPQLSRREIRQRTSFVPEEAVMSTIRTLQERGDLNPFEEEAFLEPNTPVVAGTDRNMPVGGWENEHQEEARFQQELRRSLTMDGGHAFLEERLPEHIKAQLADIPESIRAETRRVHHDLGHPSRGVLLRMAKMAGKSEQHLRYIKHFVCPACTRRNPPGQPPKGSAKAKPTCFNQVVVLDLKFARDADSEEHVFLNCLDVATRYSMFVRVKDKRALTIAGKFESAWMVWAGPPELILHDLGTEFSGAFEECMSRCGTHLKAAPLEAPWIVGLAERHGGVLGEILRITVETMHLSGVSDMKSGARFSAMAKNRRVTSSGFSARARVFGQDERLAGSVVDFLEGETQDLNGLTSDPVASRSHAIRDAAIRALHELDASETWKRVLRGKPRAYVQLQWSPGCQIYFWRKARSTQNLRGRYTRLPERWHGPGLVLGHEGSAVWVAYNGSLFLVSPEHLRHASREEALADYVWNSRLRTFHDSLSHHADSENVRYYDLTGNIERRSTTQIPWRDFAEEATPAPCTRRGRPRSSGEPDLEPMPRVVSRSGEDLEPLAEHDQEHDGVVRREDEQPAHLDERGDTTANVPAVPSETMSANGGLEVLVLKNKSFKQGSKGKEIDARWLDDLEWDLFRDADLDNWKAHIANGAVRVLSPQEAQKVPASDILRIPSRFVRVNKDKTGKNLTAKSRWVVPGHVVPRDGTRCDAPVSPQIALYCLLSLVMRTSWKLSSFDVSNAFLQGEATKRRIIVRPPKEGIPGVPEGSLIELLKGCFGLPESPRLWWIRFSSILVSTGWIPLKEIPATFVLRTPTGELCGMLCLHVDDGIWAGTGSVFASSREQLKSHLVLKEQYGPDFTLLGRRICVSMDQITVDNHEYVSKIETALVPRARRSASEALLTEQERTQYLSITAQLAWAARVSMPQISYDVSLAQQRSAGTTVKDLLSLNLLVRRAQAYCENGVRLTFKRMSHVGVVHALGIHDASFANEPGHKSQRGYVGLVCESDPLDCEVTCHMLEWESCTIRRVIRSTLGCEAASASLGYDRLTYMRVLLGTIQGETGTWMMRAGMIPSYPVTDCHSLYETVRKTGGAINEKRVQLDVQDVRDGVDSGDISMFWVRTETMLADALTKHIAKPKFLCRFMSCGKYQVDTTPRDEAMQKSCEVNVHDIGFVHVPMMTSTFETWSFDDLRLPEARVVCAGTRAGTTIVLAEVPTLATKVPCCETTEAHALACLMPWLQTFVAVEPSLPQRVLICSSDSKCDNSACGDRDCETWEPADLSMTLGSSFSCLCLRCVSRGPRESSVPEGSRCDRNS